MHDTVRCFNVTTYDPLEYASFIMAFEARILPYVTTEANKLYYLDQQLEGCAKELIQGCIFKDVNHGYTEARHLLHMEYGDPFKVATAYIEKANNWPNLKADDGQGLRTLSHFLTKCTNAMQNISHMNVLNHPTNMQTIVLKLPLYLQNKWPDTVGRLRNRSIDRSVMFHDLAQFVKNEASSVNDPVFSKEALGQRKPKPNASVFATNVPQNAIQCYVCKQDHDIEQCKEFLAMTLSAKRMYLQQNRRCFACFGHNHLSKECRKKQQCKTCGRKHPTSLHDPNFGRLINNTQESATSSERNSSADITVETSSSAMVQSGDSSSIVLQPIVPVKVRQAGSNRVTDTYALLDNVSTGCFITEELRDQLKAKHEDSMLKLQTLHGIKHVPTSIVHNLEVSDLHDRNVVKLPKCYTRQEIPVDHSQIPKRELFNHFPHLAEVAKEIPPYFQHLGIGLLIGANCSVALQPLRVIPVNGDGPYAVLHKHGWTVNGQVKSSSNGHGGVSCHRVMFKEIREMGIQTEQIEEKDNDNEIKASENDAKETNNDTRDYENENEENGFAGKDVWLAKPDTKSECMDDETLRMLFCEVEAIVNSRQLTPVSDSPDDLSPLTPNNALGMETGVIVPPPGIFQREDIYLRKRWRRVQHLANTFWKRWKREFLMTLQQRSKWNKENRNLQVNDIVLLKDENNPRNEWPLGRIQEVEQSNDGLARSVKLKTKNGVLRRPVNKLVLLIPTEEQHDDSE